MCLTHLLWNVHVIQFWSELSPQARQKLLRIDKQTLFEQARKNMYCSRCNGLLLEGFMQIVLYGKSLQQDGAVAQFDCKRSGALRSQNNGNCGSSITNGLSDENQDPSVHPWGGLTTTRDNSLTLTDCYLYSKSLKGLQIVSLEYFCGLLFGCFSSFLFELLFIPGLWWGTCKGAGKRNAVSWCMWWRRAWLDKPRNNELRQGAWGKGNLCTSHRQTFMWYTCGFLVGIGRWDQTVSFKDEGRRFYRETYVQVSIYCTLLACLHFICYI